MGLQIFDAAHEVCIKMGLLDNDGDQSDTAEHRRHLGIGPRHHHSDPPFLQGKYRLFDGVQARLVDVRHLLHPEDHDADIGERPAQLRQTGDEPEEDRAVEVLDVDVVTHFIGQFQLIGPRLLFEIFIHGSHPCLILGDVADLFHEEHRGHHHPDGDRFKQVVKDGDDQNDDHDRRIGAGDFGHVPDPFVIDDADADGDQDTGEDRHRDLLRIAARPEQYDQ